jgi:hypothetical protein
MKIFIQMSIALLFFLAGSISMQAQDLSKEEAKKWKKVAKEYKKNPAALKILTEERDRYRQEAESAEQRIQAAQSELLQEKERNSDLQEQVTQHCLPYPGGRLQECSLPLQPIFRPLCGRSRWTEKGIARRLSRLRTGQGAPQPTQKRRISRRLGRGLYQRPPRFAERSA